MRPLPSPNSINSADARREPMHWASIYGPFPNMLAVPDQSARNNMRSSKSNQNLKSLPESMENLAVDRTANSTPANRKKDTSLHRNATLTPPSDKKIELNDPNKITKEHFGQSNANNIFLRSQVEDDVFGGFARPRPEIASNPTNGLIVPAAVNFPNAQGFPNALVAPSAPGTPSSSGAPVFAVAGQVVDDHPASTSIPPNPDQHTEKITDLNAQGKLPPSNSIFVANLSIHRSEVELIKSCHEAFDKFGECYVRVKHDKRRHPYALVTYAKFEDAERAIDEGRVLVIDGRPARTEWAEVRRALILSRNGSGAITVAEAEELCGQYGKIEKMRPTTHADHHSDGLPAGMWVQFTFHDNYKVCLKQLSSPVGNQEANPFYVTEAPNLESSHPVHNGGPPVVPQGLRTPRSSTDQKSIFVGNLPDDTTETELLEIFARYGQIRGCNVIRKPITGGQGFNIFGFIEYANGTEAEAASDAEMEIRGQKIRVEPKEYSARRHTRLQPYRRPPPEERLPLPRGINWGPSANGYQSPSAPLPFGFQPVYLQPPAGGFPNLPPGYSWTITPPGSIPRRRAPGPAEYFMAGSPPPQQFLPMHPSNYSMPTYRDAGAESPQQPPSQHYQ